MVRETLRQELKSLIRRYYENEAERDESATSPAIPLNVPSFGWEEVWESLDSLLSTQVTMGRKVKQFEQMFADYIGVNHAIMVNSGSSANLLALSVLTNPVLSDHWVAGDEIITPAVTWATTVFPMINCGLVPVLVDVDIDTFNLLPEEVEKAITPRTKAIMPVHLLGNPCDMDTITAISQKHNLRIIEDTCEAHGAEWKGKKVGSFGDFASFSFFFTHHISTIEGGMLVTDNEELAELARAMRVFGWIRELRDRESLAALHPDIDPRYLFINLGFNLRPTEIQGAFGIHQLPKLDNYIEIRRANAGHWADSLNISPHIKLHREIPDTRHVWFGYPIIAQPGAPLPAMR